MVFIDAKPLPVGAGTKDPDAAAGYAGAGIAKGYKLHAICNARRIPLAWCIHAMNESEGAVAPELIRQLPSITAGVLVGDHAYDKNRLYDEAGMRGWQLFAPRGTGKALGHRRHSPWRLIAHTQRSNEWRAALSRSRLGIERFFAHLTGGSLGLAPLPSWVRGLRRVCQWVQMKIIIYLATRSNRLPQTAI